MKRPADWARRHIRDLKPYTAARDLYAGGGRLFLDANESPFPTAPSPPVTGLERYPDPRCGELREALARWLGLDPAALWIGNGSDEALDLLLRTFVEPGETVAVCAPTYGMYEIAARAHGAAVVPVALDDRFDLAPDAADAASGAKLIFLCSPNNPTGNRLSVDRVVDLVREFDGLVVLDEAYVEFSSEPSLIGLTAKHTNLVVLRTFSKAWGLAGARVGYMVADPETIELIERINLPYPLSALSSAVAARALADAVGMEDRVRRIVAERGRLAERLADLDIAVFPSDANFVLVRVSDAAALTRRLAEEFGIVVRDRSDAPLLDDCIRITVGTGEENDRLCAALEEIRG